MSKPNSPFIKHPEDYSRVSDIVGEANKQSAMYLHVMTGKSYDECLTFMTKETSEGGKFAPRPMEVKATFRKPNGDRVLTKLNLHNVVTKSHKSGGILTPNLVVYDNPEVNKSFIAEAIDEDMARRTIIKKESIIADQEKQVRKAIDLSNEESAIKLGINGISGAHLSPHNPLYNKTAHSTLTSVCRVITSYSNASTERLLMGNRHYFDDTVILDNLLSITTIVDMAKIQKIQDKFNLYVPTVEDVIEVINYSRRLYNPTQQLPANINEFINKLTPLQRVAFTYTGDFYHLRTFNESFMRTFIGKFLERPTLNVEDADKWIKEATGDVISLNSFLCSDLLAGRSFRNMVSENPEYKQIFADSLANVHNICQEYLPIIEGFLSTENLPSRVYSFPSSLRRSVVGSDTDSTMFTCQQWVEWYYGKLEFHEESIRISNIICYFNVQTSAHWFASVSKQMGIVDSNLYRLEMKNEYAFLLYLRANVAKHYATLVLAREGSIFSVPKIDIKGVQLRDSKLAPAIMQGLEKYIKDLMMQMVSGKYINIYEVLVHVASIETVLFDSLKRRKTTYLTKISVNSSAAYKSPDNPRYQSYTLWRDVFAKEHGVTEPPPYKAVKISTTINNKTDWKAFVDKLQPSMQQSLNTWMDNNGKSLLKTFYLPLDVVDGGFPEMFLDTSDSRRVVSELMNGYYILLEMLGFYYRNKHKSRLVSDEINIPLENIPHDILSLE